MPSKPAPEASKLAEPSQARELKQIEKEKLENAMRHLQRSNSELEQEMQSDHDPELRTAVQVCLLLLALTLCMACLALRHAHSSGACFDTQHVIARVVRSNVHCACRRTRRSC